MCTIGFAGCQDFPHRRQWSVVSLIFILDTCYDDVYLVVKFYFSGPFYWRFVLVFNFYPVSNFSLVFVTQMCVNCGHLQRTPRVRAA